jgi:uncharacterized protein (DUF924 family)
MNASVKAVLDFWFKELTPEDHFKKNLELDKKITQDFSILLNQALKGELFSWRKEASGRLAEIIVLDQFSRNIYRDSSAAFAGDIAAVILSQEMVLFGLDRELDIAQRAFVYMPYMHSESKVLHEMAVELFSQKGLESNLKFELMHKRIIDQFGRFPHRNKALGRMSTPAELEFLKGPGSSF